MNIANKELISHLNGDYWTASNIDLYEGQFEKYNSRFAYRMTMGWEETYRAFSSVNEKCYIWTFKTI